MEQENINSTPPIKEESSSSTANMDFTIDSSEGRVEKVREIIAQTPPERLTPKYLEKLADYILQLDRKQKDKTLLTDNHMVTVNRRETSFEGLVGKLENGEDGIYGMIANDKNIIFSPKVSITEKDKEDIPELKELCNAIKVLEEQVKNARGKRAYSLRQQLIKARQDQYVIKNAYKQPMYCTNLIKSISKVDLSDHITIDADGGLHNTGLVDFFNPQHISAMLCNYSKLVEDSYDKLNSDAKWMMMDFDNLTDAALKDYPLYYDLMVYKIDGRSNAEIQDLLYETYGIRHTSEYISSLWRNKIPKLIAETAQKQWLDWHYTQEEPGKWKKCSRCGEIKLAHPFYFSKNGTSKDHFYSICKECRNKKSKGLM